MSNKIQDLINGQEVFIDDKQYFIEPFTDQEDEDECQVVIIQGKWPGRSGWVVLGHVNCHSLTVNEGVNVLPLEVVTAAIQKANIK